MKKFVILFTDSFDTFFRIFRSTARILTTCPAYVQLLIYSIAHRLLYLARDIIKYSAWCPDTRIRRHRIHFSSTDTGESPLRSKCIMYSMLSSCQIADSTRVQYHTGRRRDHLASRTNFFKELFFKERLFRLGVQCTYPAWLPICCGGRRLKEW